MSDIETLIDAMTRTASDFLDSLTADQQKKALLPFGDEAERRSWFYTPTPRAGLPMLEMAPKQQQHVMRLLASGLSEAGYNHAAVVMGLERIVDYTSNFPDRTYGDLPDTRVRDPGNYCVAVFGTPGDTAGWSWRIGGHHLALHYTVRDGFVSSTPAFYGAEPARVVMPGGALLRALPAEEDFARDLLKSLSDGQRAKAIISPVAPTDIVQTNRPRIEDGALYNIGGGGPGGQGLRDKLGLTPEHDEILRYSASTPKGLVASAMDAGQRETFMQLVRTYFDHVPEAIAAQYASILDPNRFDMTAFAWAGSDEFAAPHYYRIQSEALLIEYDCTQNEANHTHSVWRDPRGDFGDNPLVEHYAAAHS
jgi:hypothetical protein